MGIWSLVHDSKAASGFKAGTAPLLSHGQAVAAFLIITLNGSPRYASSSIDSLRRLTIERLSRRSQAVTRRRKAPLADDGRVFAGNGRTPATFAVLSIGSQGVWDHARMLVVWGLIPGYLSTVKHLSSLVDSGKEPHTVT